MTPEAKIVLDQANNRRRLLHTLIHSSGYLPRQPLKTKLVNKIADVFIADIEVNGAKNLATATKLLDEGHEVTHIGNHTSDGDIALRRLAFERTGHANFANRQLWVAGASMLERWYTRIFMGAEESIMVVTPLDLRRIKAVATSEDTELNPDQRSIVAQYLEAANLLNKRSSGVAQAKRASGYGVSVFPESTRSRNGGMMQEAIRETGVYLARGYVLPVAGFGIQEWIPVNGNFRIKRVNVRVDIGEPIPAKEIWEKSVRFYGGRGHNPAEVAMAYVAVLNPRLVSKEREEHYKQLLAA